MIFETLWESSKKGELLLLDGAFCHWHLRRDGQLTIREIISQKKGQGSKILDILKRKKPESIFAKCPSDLEANEWYRQKGFLLEKTEKTKSGRLLNHWRLVLINDD